MGCGGSIFICCAGSLFGSISSRQHRPGHPNPQPARFQSEGRHTQRRQPLDYRRRVCASSLLMIIRIIIRSCCRLSHFPVRLNAIATTHLNSCVGCFQGPGSDSSHVIDDRLFDRVIDNGLFLLEYLNRLGFGASHQQRHYRAAARFGLIVNHSFEI